MSAAILVLDLGNTRLKWGHYESDNLRFESVATSLDDTLSWQRALDRLTVGSWTGVAISSVNPPVADRLSDFLKANEIGSIRWFRSAADVPVRHQLANPLRTGADRALAVLAAGKPDARPGPGIVVQCGTAITVERIAPDGEWQGGAIAIGPALAARALNTGTAQLPDLEIFRTEASPMAWGDSTDAALIAGIVWGAVGAIRELIDRQSEGLHPSPWVVWTGGDASLLAPLVSVRPPLIDPELVLRGLAIAFRGGLHESTIDSVRSSR